MISRRKRCEIVLAVFVAALVAAPPTAYIVVFALLLVFISIVRFGQGSGSQRGGDANNMNGASDGSPARPGTLQGVER